MSQPKKCSINCIPEVQTGVTYIFVQEMAPESIYRGKTSEMKIRVGFVV